MDDLKRLDPEKVDVFTTPEGVMGIVAKGIPDAVLDGLAQKLRDRISARERGSQLDGGEGSEPQ